MSPPLFFRERQSLELELGGRSYLIRGLIGFHSVPGKNACPEYLMELLKVVLTSCEPEDQLGIGQVDKKGAPQEFLAASDLRDAE